VHTWSSKAWGDNGAKPDRKRPVPEGMDWNLWLGVCTERPFIGDHWYHPGNWRKRLDFGTGTFGDMGCHIYDPSSRRSRSLGRSACAAKAPPRTIIRGRRTPSAIMFSPHRFLRGQDGAGHMV